MVKWPQWEPSSQERTRVDTLIISDIHLGSRTARVRELAKAISLFRFDRLILLGDIFDDLNFNRLTEIEWEFLGWLRKLTNLKREKEVVWIIGNHDKMIAEVFRHFLGLPVYREYAWNYGEKKYLATHGDQFDRFIVNNPVVSEVAAKAYYYFKKYGDRKQRISRFVRRRSKRWLRLNDKIAVDAMRYAKDNDASVIFCGHTHRPYDNRENGTRYVNTGCWTDSPSTLVSVGFDGKVDIHTFR